MFLLLFCLGVTFIAAALYLKWEYSAYVKTIARIPQPPKLPAFGNALLIPREPCGKEMFLKSVYI